MRFYMITLSIYAVGITILAGLLAVQNRELKTSGAGQPIDVPIDYEKIHAVDTQDIPMLGDANARVTIVEYSDFQCQFCAGGSKFVRDLMAQHPGKLRLGYKNLLLASHPEAEGAAIAALAAYRQGKFWEMEEQLFANQKKLGPAYYEELAGELGLDMNSFASYREPGVWDEYLQQQNFEAKMLGIRATPTFFVNGVKVLGTKDLAEVVNHFLNQ